MLPGGATVSGSEQAGGAHLRLGRRQPSGGEAALGAGEGHRHQPWSPSGHSPQLRFEFEPTGEPDIPHGKGAPGRARLYVDGDVVGESDFPLTTPVMFNPGGLTCGANPALPVDPEYRSPFPFTGTLHSVTLDLSGDLIVDTEGEMRMVMARQ